MSVFRDAEGCYVCACVLHEVEAQLVKSTPSDATVPCISCCSGESQDAEIVCDHILNESDLAPGDVIICSGAYEVGIELYSRICLLL